MDSDNVIEIRKLSQQYAYASLLMHETFARSAGFSSTDHKYLGFFLQKGKLTAGELSELTGLTTGAVTGLIDRFEKKELVRREFDKSDRRKVVIVSNSEKIMALLEPFYKNYQAATDELITSFSINDREVIRTYLKKALALTKESTQNLKQK